MVIWWYDNMVIWCCDDHTLLHGILHIGQRLQYFTQGFRLKSDIDRAIILRSVWKIQCNDHMFQTGKTNYGKYDCTKCIWKNCSKHN
jgi:hypothetical protein